MTTPDARSPIPGDKATMRAAIGWGVVVGLAQAATPVAFWWLDAAAVYALGLALIASIYIGFAVADGRARIIVVECVVAMAFVVIAAAGITGPAWLLAFGLAAHGIKDAWQQRRQFVSGTRWWPPFCAAVDWVVAVIIGVEIDPRGSASTPSRGKSIVGSICPTTVLEVTTRKPPSWPIKPRRFSSRRRCRTCKGRAGWPSHRYPRRRVMLRRRRRRREQPRHSPAALLTLNSPIDRPPPTDRRTNRPLTE